MHVGWVLAQNKWTIIHIEGNAGAEAEHHKHTTCCAKWLKTGAFGDFKCLTDFVGLIWMHWVHKNLRPDQLYDSRVVHLWILLSQWQKLSQLADVILNFVWYYMSEHYCYKKQIITCHIYLRPEPYGKVMVYLDTERTF